MMIRLLFLLSLPVFAVSCKKGKHNDEACNGDTRREVKIMTDAGASQVDTVPSVVSISDLGALSVPEVDKETSRQAEEKKTYTVTAKVEKVKRERDGDYHIRLVEGEKYLITESVNPDCDYAQSSAFLSKYKRVREFIDSHDLEGKTVTITGVAFIDIDHHYKRKQAENNIELHPILDIHF